MKLKFKVQPYQTHAVEAVVDCFSGQPMVNGVTYRIDPGLKAQASVFEDGFKNADIAISDDQVLANIKDVQRRQNLPISNALVSRAGCKFNLDVEMETGTGKTYCYIKTVFELNKRYGWSKFIVMVPSIAIREGVYKSLQITADHFAEIYGKKARFFIYNSKKLNELESFSSDAGINIMVINVQAFAAKSADNRRIYDELDDFQSRKPIDVIAGNRPIVILDEPQKMEGAATMEALPKFKPLMILRYSATHRTQHNRVHRLDALDAYNQKLVKKIAVRGIQTRGLAGTNAYLYLESIEISRKAPIARVELEVRLKSGEIKRLVRRLEFGDDLFVVSGELDQYRDGFTISQIDARNDTVEFTNGLVLRAGDAVGDVAERDIRRIQIRETIKAHFDKEKQLFDQGIKVLSLFFIDEVVRYRDYAQADEKGEGFELTDSTTERGGSIHSTVRYDLLGKIGESAELTRRTVAEILSGIQPRVFEQFRDNPEHFISEASRIISEQKATMVIERLAYDGLSDRYDIDIFTANQTGQDFSGASAKLKHHIYDYVITDSDVERRFAGELDASDEVVVYAKLPRGFLIPTPVGDYNPDWAIAFRAGAVKHIYFVAETKGTMSSLKLREIENTKIACARKFFDEIGQRISEDRVKYDVVDSYEALMDLVAERAA